MCVLQLVERGASAFPNAVAVRCKRRQVTYSDLNLTADRIAQGLRDAGVSSGTLVGLFLDRSPEMVAGLLGIWKAGGAYIPLDPTAPRQRIAFMLEDSAPPFVLTLNKLRDGLPSTTAQVINLDDFQATRTSQDPAMSTISEDSVAYVIYTSGSTGKPKGVSITHGALANTIRGVGEDLKLQADDIVLAWSTIAFDVACSGNFPASCLRRQFVSGRDRSRQWRRFADGASASFRRDRHLRHAHHVPAPAGRGMAGRSEDATDRRRRGSSSEPCADSDQDVPRALEPIWAERDGDLRDPGKNRFGCREDHHRPSVAECHRSSSRRRLPAGAAGRGR